jgi:hypothetical protein
MAAQAVVVLIRLAFLTHLDPAPKDKVLQVAYQCLTLGVAVVVVQDKLARPAMFRVMAVLD